METENAAAAAAAAFTASSQLKEAVLGREPACPLRTPAGWSSRPGEAAYGLEPQGPPGGAWLESADAAQPLPVVGPQLRWWLDHQGGPVANGLWTPHESKSKLL